jgi:hypothetical protein
MWVSIIFKSIIMLNPKIKTHKLGVTYSQPHFFILNKGRNAGKPSPDWYSNSFVFLADNEDEKWHFYYLCQALWQGKYFHQILIGSVIEFIRIDEFTMALHHANITISQNKADFNEIIGYFQQLDKHQANLTQQIKLIHQVRQSMVYKMLHK